MSYLIGVDIGTSATKTVLFNEDGAILASVSAEYPLYQPRNGWAEQDPDDWWRASRDTIRAVTERSGISAGDIKGIGLSGQMHGLVMLDAAGKVIRPSIIWCDGRTGAQCEEITRLVGKDDLLRITANPAVAGFTASKILWVRENEPENYAKCRHILLPKDYIRYKLTGEFATEVSDGSGMQLMDIGRRCWSDTVLQRLQIDKALLGRMYESCEPTGGVSAAVAAECGLAAGTLVVGGAGDNAAAAVGNGIVRQGVLNATIGTSGIVFAHMDGMAVDPQGRAHTMCHAVPGAWHIMGVTQAAGLSYKWLRDNFFEAEKQTAAELGVDANRIIDDIAATVPAGANGLLYLPYLMGERTPWLDPDCRGVFFGLSAIHTKKDMLRAVLEGVIFSLRDCLEIVNSLGVKPKFVFAGGGGANSPLWRQMMADVFNIDVATASSKEAGALGVAILAGVAAGIYKSVPEACDRLVHAEKMTKPACSEQVKAVYDRAYELYTELYPALKESFGKLSGLMM